MQFKYNTGKSFEAHWKLIMRWEKCYLLFWVSRSSYIVPSSGESGRDILTSSGYNQKLEHARAVCYTTQLELKIHRQRRKSFNKNPTCLHKLSLPNKNAGKKLLDEGVRTYCIKYIDFLSPTISNCFYLIYSEQYCFQINSITLWLPPFL